LRIIDHPLLGARSLHPRPKRVANSIAVAADGVTLSCWRSAPHAGAPTVLHFHGNGEVVADYVPWFANELVGLGVNVAFAEYRGYGGSTGKATLGAMLADAPRVLKGLALDPREVIVFVRSIGSYAAFELASRFPLAGMIIESGIADPLERILSRVTPEELGVSAAALHAEVAEHLDHEKKLSTFRAPLLVLHAVRDELVDASHAVRIASWSPSVDRELVLLPRGGHNSILAENHEAYFKALRSFFGRIKRSV
jgi:pimeloyl-ACP methyl ester carboxylesterase